VDSISNSVPNYDVLAGAQILAEACREFPKGTAFCCVVDPGVGTPRKRIALETKAGQFFVAPDNGLLSLVAARDGVAALHETENKAYWREGVVSSTFQGRDIFGPVTAALASGVPIGQVGPPLAEMVKLDAPVARVEKDVIVGAVMRSDDYGNLVTNIPVALMEQAGLRKGDQLQVRVGKSGVVAPYVSTYADVPTGAPLVCSQSIGHVEIAINQGSMAERLGEGVHAEVILQKAAEATAEGAQRLRFQQSGGIAGQIDTLEIAADGTGTLARRRGGSRKIKIAPDEAARLFSALHAALNTREAPRPGAPLRGGADYMTYELALGAESVTYTDLNLPETFRPLVNDLAEHVAALAKR